MQILLILSKPDAVAENWFANLNHSLEAGSYSRKRGSDMLKSMTGYGRGECICHDRRFKVEMKSVNHRANDFSVKLPRFLAPFEDKIRRRLAQEIVRGKVDCWVNFESFTSGDISVKTNETYAAAYMNALATLSARCGLGEIPPESMFEILARTPEIIISDRFENVLNSESAKDEIWEGLSQALEQALSQHTEMRITEGSALEKDIVANHLACLSLIEQIRASLPQYVKEYAAKLHARINELTGNLGGETDDTRLLTEIALLADKTDISEELTRLASHFEQFASMQKECGTIGRKMDFIVQEMNREANTLASKSADVTLTKTVIELKSLIEKIREQVQNVE